MGGGGGGSATVMLSEQVVWPPGPETVITKLDVVVTKIDFEPESVETSPMPWLRVAFVAATVVHESTDEPPPKASDDGFAESVQVGIIGGIIGGGITGGGGGGGDGGVGGGGGTTGGGSGGTTGGGVGTTQQGGPITCANTCAGVTRPDAKAIEIPKAVVSNTVKTPVKIGLSFRYVCIVFSFVIL